METIYDLIIVGSGPAGLCAAIYVQRAKLSCITIERNYMSGGQVINTYEVDNYPGSSKEKKWLYKMGKEFGFGNVGMQISAMESYKDFIQKEILQKEKKFQDNKKLILYFGVMSGLLLSIILL